jgi:SAM-dependent methyltransferase
MMMKRFIHQLKLRSKRAEIYSTAAYWDSKADTHLGHAVSMWPNNVLNGLYHDEVIQLLNRHLADIQGWHILDLGCGTGRISRYLASKGARVTAIDFSSKSLEIAQQTTDTANVTYRLQSMFDLADSKAYDCIVSWGSVTVACQNNPQLKNVLARLRRAIRDKGTCLLLEPIHRGFVHRVLDMNLDQFLGEMKGSGFEIVEVSQMHFWPARYVLAFIEWPRWITCPLYHAGQNMLRWPGLKAMGDYKAVLASAV